jgi:hypothetical protein
MFKCWSGRNKNTQKRVVGWAAPHRHILNALTIHDGDRITSSARRDAFNLLSTPVDVRVLERAT